MFRVKWAWVALFLVLGSGSVRAQEGVCGPAVAAEIPAAIAPAVVLEQSVIVPAVLQWIPGESPLVLQFASAPPITPSNRCEAQCVAEFRQCQRDCRNVLCLIPCELLLDVCAADCTSEV